MRCSGNYWRSPRLPVVVVTSQYPFPYPPSLKPPGSERLPGIWTGPASYQVYSRSLFVQPSTHFNKVLFLHFLESFMKRKCKDIFQSFQMTFLIDKAVQGRYIFLPPSIIINQVVIYFAQWQPSNAHFPVLWMTDWLISTLSLDRFFHRPALCKMWNTEPENRNIKCFTHSWRCRDDKFVRPGGKGRDPLSRKQ